MGRAALLALVLVLALPMGAAGAPTDAPAAAEPPAASLDSLQDVAILTLNGSSRTSFATASVDLGTALAIRHDTASSRLDRYTLNERFQRTESTEARKTMLFEAATAAEIRIAGLRDDERDLRAAYVARDIDTETFVRRLVRLHARVSGLRADLDGVQAHADDIPQFSMRGRVRLLDATLFGFEGPVRERTLATMRGDAPPTRLYIEVSESGVVVATIEDGRYVREAYRADQRDTETISAMSINEAVALSRELYPVAYNSSENIRTSIGGLTGGLYQLDIELREGTIRTFMDGATRGAFFEVQERRLDLLGPRPSVVGTDNGTRLVVNRSYPGGPLQVVVAAEETGEPRQTTVVVEGARFETGTDGLLWTLSPAGPGPFEVMAVGPSGNVTVTVRPFQPMPATAEG